MKSEMFVSISVLCGHPYIQSLTNDSELVVKAACTSEKVIVDVENYIIKPKYKIERTTIILRDMPLDAGEHFIKGLFDASRPHITSANKVTDNIWFVSFESEQTMLEAFAEVKKNKINEKSIQVRVKSENLLKATLCPNAGAIRAIQYYGHVRLAVHPGYNNQFECFPLDYGTHPSCTMSPMPYTVPRANPMNAAASKKKNTHNYGTAKRVSSTSGTTAVQHARMPFNSSNRAPRRRHLGTSSQRHASTGNATQGLTRSEHRKDLIKNTSGHLVAPNLALSNFPPLTNNSALPQSHSNCTRPLSTGNASTSTNHVEQLSSTCHDDIDNLVSTLRISSNDPARPLDTNQCNSDDTSSRPSQSEVTPPLDKSPSTSLGTATPVQSWADLIRSRIRCQEPSLSTHKPTSNAAHLSSI